MRFDCSLRTLSVYGAWGKSIQAVRESITKRATGETGFMKDLVGAGASEWKAFKKKWLKQAAHIRKRDLSAPQ